MVQKKGQLNIRANELVFFIVYILNLVQLLIKTSTIQEYIFIDSTLSWGIRIVTLVFIFIKICLYDRFEVREFLIYLLILMLSGLVYWQSKSFLIFDVVILIVAAKDIPFRKIVKVFYYVVATGTILFFILSLFGIIENFENITVERGIRYAFGNIYATDFAATLFYLQLAGAYLRNRRYNTITFIFWLAIAAFIYVYCDARLDTILIVLFALFMYNEKWITTILDVKFIRNIYEYSFLILTGFSILLYSMYDSSNTYFSALNRALSGRLYLGKNAIEEYGWSLFGKSIKLQGNGWSLNSWDSFLGYNYIDSGYLQIGIKSGIIVLILIVIVFTLITIMAIKNKNYILATIIFFIGVTTVVDQHILSVVYNPFLFLIPTLIKNKNLE